MLMDETFDFVVVGSGGGSMCAGLAMRKAGKSVLVLEKTDLIGGSTARAGGVMWIPNNRFLAAAGADSLEEARTYLDAVVGDRDDAPGARRERREAYLREAPAMLDFLIGEGLRFRRAGYWPDYYDERPGGLKQGRAVVPELFDLNELGPWKDKLRGNRFQLPILVHEAFSLPLIKVSWRARWAALKTGWRQTVARLTGRRWATAGAALQGRMLQAAVRAGVEIRTGAPVRELLTEEGRVVGVRIEANGRSLSIGARLGVLLNAGGFAHNQAMRDEHIPHTRVEWTHAAPGDTGDMHAELIRIGAWMAQMDQFVGNQMTLPPGAVEAAGAQLQLAKPHALLVDQTGVRYMNEGGSYMAFCRGMLDRHKVAPAVPSWMIVDDQFIRKYMLGDSMPGSGKPAKWFETGYLRQADSLGKLAAKCGIPPSVLVATVERFNGFARNGHDADFGRGERAYDRFLGDHTHRPSPTLGTIKCAPFYAVQVVPGDVGTFGGVVTDVHARAMREDGTVIAGLYATGTTTAAVMGHAYPGAGCSIGPAFTWGYVAAKHALGIEA